MEEWKIGMGSENERFKDIKCLKSHSWDFQWGLQIWSFYSRNKIYIIYIKQGDDDILNALTS